VTVTDTLISSVKVLAMLAWLKHLDLASHWLEQYTTPVRAKPDSKPRLEGAHYKYLTSCSHLLNPTFPILHTHIAHTYQFPSSLWASTFSCYMHSALRSGVGLTSAGNNKRTNEPDQLEALIYNIS